MPPSVTVTTAVPPWPWIAIAAATVAKFKYPAECVAHKCPRHPNKGPPYYSLSTVGTLPAELHPALKTHLREQHGDLAVLAPHGLVVLCCVVLCCVVLCCVVLCCVVLCCVVLCCVVLCCVVLCILLFFYVQKQRTVDSVCALLNDGC